MRALKSLIMHISFLRSQQLVLNSCVNLHRKPNVHWDVHWNVHWRTLERTLAYTGKTGGFGHGAQNASGLARTPPRRQEYAPARADAPSLSSSAQNAGRHAREAMSQNVGGPARAPPRRVHTQTYVHILNIYIYIYVYVYMYAYMDLYILHECTYVFVFSSSSKAASCKRLGATV